MSNNKKGKVRCFVLGRRANEGVEGRRRTEKDVRSREVSPYNRLLVRLPMPRTFFACHLHHYLTSACSFCASVPWNVLPLPFRSRCTVAFGLCIIITITASSSWLVGREASSLSFSLFSFSFSIRLHFSLPEC